jgi:segregation and condensation protein B
MSDTSGLRGVLEALLFVTDEPMSASRAAKLVDLPETEVTAALKALAEEYARDERGFQLREVAGGWRLYTHPAHHPIIEQSVLSWDTRRLSQAALEALAVVAYHQPVARQGINAVRGVNSEAVLASLQEKGLIREAGRDRSQGNAVLYATTRTFLEKFGLKDLSELPPLEEFAPDARTESAIRDRLSAIEGPQGDGDDDENDGIATVD